MKKKLVANTLINSVSQFVSAGINLYLVSYLVRNIGGERYGLYVLILALVSYADFFRYGLGSSVIRYVAEYSSNNDSSKANELISTSLLFFFIQGVVTAIILSVLILLFMESIFNVPSHYVFQIKFLGLILLAYLFFDLLFATFGKIIEGLQRYDLLRLTEILKKILLAVLITIIIMADYGFEFIGFAYLISSIVAGIVTIFMSFRHFKYRIGVTHINKAMCRQIFSFAWPQFLGKLTGFFGSRIDVLLLGIFLQPISITIYNIVYQFYLLITTVLGLLGSAVFPHVSELHSRDQGDHIKKLFLSGTRYSMFISMPLIVGAIALAKPFITSWVGLEYGNYSYLAQIYLLPAILMTSGVLAGQIAVGLDIVRYTIKYHIIGTVINFIVSIILVRHIGIAGVIIGTGLGFFIAWYPSNNIVLRKLTVGWNEFLQLLLLRPVTAAVISVPAIFVLNTIAFPDNLFAVLMYGCFYTVLFALLFYFIGFDRSERRIMMDNARQILALKS